MHGSDASVSKNILMTWFRRGRGQSLIAGTTSRLSQGASSAHLPHQSTRQLIAFVERRSRCERFRHPLPIEPCTQNAPFDRRPIALQDEDLLDETLATTIISARRGSFGLRLFQCGFVSVLFAARAGRLGSRAKSVSHFAACLAGRGVIEKRMRGDSGLSSNGTCFT